MFWKIMIFVALFIINIPVYRFIFKIFFSNPNDYDESVRYSFTPNFISFLRGEYWQDKIATTRLQVFSVICVVIVAIEFFLIIKIIELFR